MIKQKAGLQIGIIIVFLCVALWHPVCSQPQTAQPNKSYAIVLHGGAGVMRALQHDIPKQRQYKNALLKALSIGDSLLKSGGSSLDAVEQTIRYLEDNPLFNAGRGAVYSSKGICELDASIMNGHGCTAGAVGGVTTVQHPISAARAVMEKTKHVFLASAGADTFARKVGLNTVPNTYFQTRPKSPGNKASGQTHSSPDKWGTVGCVALDKDGHLAAGTSTGGLSGKKWGRIGDSPIIGAGTYADDKTCAVSCTGIGEYFIRYSIAYDVSARMKYKHLPLSHATREVIDQLSSNKGSGGVIAVDNNGNISTQFNTPGMFRAWSKNGAFEVHVFKE